MRTREVSFGVKIECRLTRPSMFYDISFEVAVGDFGAYYKGVKRNHDGNGQTDNQHGIENCGSQSHVI